MIGIAAALLILILQLPGVPKFDQPGVFLLSGLSVAGLLIWPISALSTHLLARSWKLKAPIAKVMQATGKAWGLQAATAALGFTLAAVLVSKGWWGLATIWLALWPAFGSVIWWAYPTALKAVYGSDIRAGWIAFLSFGSWIVFCVGVAYAVNAIGNRSP